MKGLIDQVTYYEIGGWISLQTDIDEKTVFLSVDGRTLEIQPIYIPTAQNSDSDKYSGYDYRFVFKIDDTIHQMKTCNIEVISSSGTSIAPGIITFNPTSLLKKKTWNFEDIDASVKINIESIQTSKELQNEIRFLSQWFGLAVDRASALSNFESRKNNELRVLIEKNGSLGGALSHIMGLVQSNYSEIYIPRRLDYCVSIIIPVHNNFQLTYNCVRSLSRFMEKTSFEVIIVDDLSSDETLLASLIFLGAFKILRNGSNLGFVGSCNAGAEVATGKYLFFLNNDTLVQANGWLDSLVKTFVDERRAGIVGSRLLFENGKLQECGGIIWRDASGWNWGRNGDPSNPKFRYRREADYVSGAALMIPRDLFENIDGFDLRYSPGYYEDTDLCFKVREAGFKVLVQPASTIIHLEGQSAGTDISSGMKRFQVINKKKFALKWERILKNHQENGRDSVIAAERYVDKVALFVDDSVLTPNKDAGSNAALQHIMSLQRLGWKVVFVPSHNMADISPYTQALEALGVECIYAPHFWSLEDFLRRDIRNFEIIYLHRFSNADKYMNLCRSMRSKSKIIFNIADLHSLRNKRGLDLKSRDQAVIDTGDVDPDRELDLIEKADVAIVHSTYEKDFIIASRPKSNVKVVGWSVPTVKDVDNFANRSNIAFLGGYNHKPNVDAVIWFVTKVYPLLYSRRSDIRFLIVGSHMPMEFKNLDIPGIDPIGFVDDVEVLLAGLKLTVAPLRYGAGIKGKVLTSLAQGTPCVMTSIAAEGLNLPANLLSNVADNPEFFVDKIIDLFDNEEKWNEVCWDGIDHIESHFSDMSVDRQMSDVISSINSVSED